MEKNQNTIKALIDRLEAKGLVERTVNLQDKRNLILTVTTGKDLIRTLSPLEEKSMKP